MCISLTDAVFEILVDHESLEESKAGFEGVGEDLEPVSVGLAHGPAVEAGVVDV